MIKNVKVTELVLDYDFYPRNDVSSENIARLVDALLTGAKLPPVIIEAKTKRVVDGFHRTRAYQKLNVETVAADFREFASDALFYETAVAANTQHGRALDSYDLRRIVERMLELGIERVRIEEIIKVPAGKFDALRRNSAVATSGRVIPLKRGLEHLQHTKLTDRQQKAVEGYGGMNASFYLGQVISLLENKLFKPTDESILRLDRLTELWQAERELYAESNQAVAA